MHGLADHLTRLSRETWERGRVLPSLALRKLFEQSGEAYHDWNSSLPGRRAGRRARLDDPVPGVPWALPAAEETGLAASDPAWSAVAGHHGWATEPSFLSSVFVFPLC